MHIKDRQTDSHAVCTFYKFAHLDDCETLRPALLGVMQDTGTVGTILLAPEGINGTISGSWDGVTAVMDWLRSDIRLADLEHKESRALLPPFHRTKVKLKEEIVTLGVSGLDTASSTGGYVNPEDWNELLSDPNLLLIDTRNEYEVSIGTFQSAINPHMNTFREFPDFVERNLEGEIRTKIAMFCTGGIRCEKSTAYLKQQGFDHVYHLRGGILNYLEIISPSDSLWQGECFVFDDRVTVDRYLDPGHYEQCHACRMPVSVEDRKSADYIPGVSCLHCVNTLSKEQIERFSEREKQVRLASKRGESHIGEAARQTARSRKAEKALEKQRQRQAGKTDSLVAG